MERSSSAWVLARTESQVSAATVPMRVSVYSYFDDLANALDAAPDTLASSEADAIWERLRAA